MNLEVVGISMDIRSSLLEPPTEDSQTYIADLVAKSKRPSKKLFDFFIIYRDTGVDGKVLPDATFSNDLKTILQEEKLVSGRRSVVGRANENLSEEQIKETFSNMSSSVVVLVVLSEAALKTFEGDVQEPNNYLLLIQFALRLHDACGVRILGLNLVSHNFENGVSTCVKFQGWQIKFSDARHPNHWIQDSIEKSMNRLFALQGINIDLEDWEFKIPTLFSSFYAAQDDLNASGWQTILRIIPWKGVVSLLLTFALSFFLPGFGFLFTLLYWKFSSKSQRHKDSRLSVSLFATGMILFVLGSIWLSQTLFDNTGGALCSRNPIKCEIMIRAGNRWARWRGLAIECNVNNQCFDEVNTGYMWQPYGFTNECATCVCNLLRAPGLNSDNEAEKSCANSENATRDVIITIIVFVLAAISLFVALTRLQQQVMITQKRTTIYRIKSNVQELKAAV